MKGDVIKNTCTRVPCIPIGPPMAKNVRYRAEFAANAVESGRICGYTYVYRYVQYAMDVSTGSGPSARTSKRHWQRITSG